MSNPKVSVVMPVYNVEAYLREAMESILRQTFTEWELIIVNDASTDSSLSIINEFASREPRIKVVNHTKNGGLVASLNDGLKQAGGNFIARMDGDDISAPDRIEKMYAWLVNNPEYGLIGSNGHIIDEKGEICPPDDISFDHEEIIDKILNGGMPFFHGSWMFRRECLDKVGTYSTVLFSGEDKDYWLRVSEQYKTANHPEKLFYYRNHSQAFTTTTSYRRVVMKYLVLGLYHERKNKGKDSLGLRYGSYFSQQRLPARIIIPVKYLFKSGEYLEKRKRMLSVYYFLIGALLGFPYHLTRNLAQKVAESQFLKN